MFVFNETEYYKTIYSSSIALLSRLKEVCAVNICSNTKLKFFFQWYNIFNEEWCRKVPLISAYSKQYLQKREALEFVKSDVGAL